MPCLGNVAFLEGFLFLFCNKMRHMLVLSDEKA